jgi:Flp pilus assembly protein TadD
MKEGIVNEKSRYRLAVVCTGLAWATFAAAQNNQQQKQNLQFQSAVSQYDAGQYAEAATQLEDLVPHVPNNFEVYELLGLVYASMSQDQKAIEHLEAAVRLKPNSGAARTNLIASLSRLGRTELAGEQFRKALALTPRDYSANHNLGEFTFKLEE